MRHDDGRGRPGPRGERWRLSPRLVRGVVNKYAALAGVSATTPHLRHLKARVPLNGELVVDGRRGRSPLRFAPGVLADLLRTC